VGPRALKDYTNDQTTQLAENVDLTETVIDVQDASNIPAETYITVNKEEMFVKSKTGNKLLVRRGEDGTSVAEHLLGTPVNKITKEDNLLVEVGDDFGFDGNVF
jgi:hypothetical protein